MKKHFLIFLLIILPFFSLKSQSGDTIHIGEVRVVSSILNLLQRQSGRSVSVISAEQIRKTPVSTIDEIIRYIPGLETQSRNLYGVQTDYSIRGSTFNQVLVMIDGVRLNDPLTGHFNGYFPIPLSEVSRIEVIRGPATAMYGTEAVGGVIHIITKNYSIPADSTASLDLTLGGGEHGLFYTDAGFSQSFVNWQFGGGFRLLSSKGYPSDDGLRDDFNLGTATLSASGMLSQKTRLFFRTAIDDRAFSARRFYTISPADTARERVQGWLSHLGLVHTGEKSFTGIDLSFKTGSDEYRFNTLSLPNKHTTNHLIIQIRNNRNIGDKLRVATGMNGNYRSILSNDRGNHDEFSGGIYSLAYLYFRGDIHLSGGLRLESDSYNPAMLLPHINLSRNMGPFTLRTMAGRTMRTPDFTERYVSTNLPFLSPGRNLGNPILTPESSWSFEVGGDVAIAAGFNAGSTAFTRYGDRLIDYVLTPAELISASGNLNPEGKYFFATNIGDVHTSGMELTISGSHTLWQFYHVEYYAGYTLQESSTDGELSKYVSNQARQLFVFNSFFRYGRLGLGLNGIMKQRDEEFAESIGVSQNPSYRLFNLQAKYAIIPEILSVELRIENIFNTEYSDILGAMLPGRWVSGGVKVGI